MDILFWSLLGACFFGLMIFLMSPVTYADERCPLDGSPCLNDHCQEKGCVAMVKED